MRKVLWWRDDAFPHRQIMTLRRRRVRSVQAQRAEQGDAGGGGGDRAMRDWGGRRPRAGGGGALKRRCLGSIWLEIFEVCELSTDQMVREVLNRC